MIGMRRRQRLFVEHYLQCWNGAEAARRAGYAPKSSDVESARLLAMPQVRALIDQRMSEISMRTDEVLLRLSQQARANLADFVYNDKIVLPTPDGGVTCINTVGINWDAVQANGYLVKSIKPTANGVAIELHDPQAALEKIGRALGMFKDNLNLSGEKIVVTLKVEND